MSSPYLYKIIPRAFERWDKNIGFFKRVKIQTLQWRKYALQVANRIAPSPRLENAARSREEKILRLQVIREMRLEEELRKVAERLRSVFDSSPNAITVTDLDGKIIDCNQRTVELHGFSSKEEVIGISAFKLIAEKDHEKAIENLKKTLIEGSIKDIEYTFSTKEGREFPAELSASVIKDSSKRVAGFVAITKDITERKKAETEAIRLREMEASSLAVKGLMHALSQKFLALIGYVNLAEGKDTIMEIKENLFSASEIATDISKYFKMFEIFTFGMRVGKSIEVKSFADRIFKETIAKFPGNNFWTKVKISEGIETIVLPPDVFSFILESLLTNAFEAIRNDGRVTLSINKQSKNGQEGFLIKVDDDGRGLSPDEKIAIFRPFYSTKPHAVALQRGLPLAVIQYAIHNLDGTIDVESELGKGSSFKIWLPLREADQEG